MNFLLVALVSVILATGVFNTEPKDSEGNKKTEIIVKESSETKQTEEQVKAFGYKGSFVRFPAWINLDKFLQAKAFREENHNFKIIFVGSVTDRKNPNIIVRAISNLDDAISLEIIGPTPNKTYLNVLKK